MRCKQHPGSIFVTDEDLLGGIRQAIIAMDIRLETASSVFLVFLSCSYPGASNEVCIT